jgi:hypothetical protein
MKVRDDSGVERNIFDSDGRLYTSYKAAAAAGGNGIYSNIDQAAAVALTGTLRGGYFVATNGQTAATGTIRGIEVKARAATSANVGANVAYLEGISVSADAKTKNVTRLYGMEIMLDGAAGGTVTTAVGLQISNNASDTQTASYGIRLNQTGGGHKAFTRDIVLQNGETIDNTTDGQVDVTIASRAAAAYAYGLKVTSDDDFFTGGAATKSYLFSVSGDRPSGSAATGDSNDALIRASGNNYAANDTNFIFRALNVSINNRSGGTLGRLEGANVGAQGKSGGTVNNILGMTITAENYGTVSDMFGGLDILLKNEAAVATTEYGIRIRNENNSIADAVAAAILVSDTGANTGWDYALDCNGASVTTAEIRLSNGETIDNLTNGTIQFVAGILKLAVDAAAYLTITQADGAGVTFASVSDGAGHIAINSNDAGTIKFNSRNYASTSGDIIGFQAKPAANVDGTATLYGAQISPRFNDGIAGAALVGLQVEPILKGATAAAISGDVRALDVRLSDDGNAGHTVGGHAACIKMYNLLTAGTFTGGVYPIVVTENGSTQAWTALMEVPTSLSSGANGGGADVYIPITINGVAAKITAKYVA